MMKKNKILILAVLLQLSFIASAQAKCDLESFKFGISYKTLMSKLKLDAEFAQPEQKGVSQQLVFAPGEEVCKNEEIFKGVPIHFILLYDKLVEIQVMRVSKSPILVEWAESIYGEYKNKPNSFYHEKPLAQWYWEGSKAIIAYSVEYISNEVLESLIIQSLNHQKYFERLSKEEESE
jgi:hypothetical protein